MYKCDLDRSMCNVSKLDTLMPANLINDRKDRQCLDNNKPLKKLHEMHNMLYW